MDTIKHNLILKKISTFINQEYPDIQCEVQSTSSNLGFKMEIVGIEKDKIKDIENRNKRLSTNYGFTQNIVGMEFEGMGTKKLNHKITGFKTANRRYPILTTDTASGKGYKHSVESVKKQLGGDRLINRKSNLDKLLK